MIPFIGPDDALPPVERALDEPNGLLAAGGSLSVPSLVRAYARGVFPWFGAGDPVLWWCPDPRLVLVPSELRRSRSLGKRLRRADYTVTSDTAFAEVVDACAAPRRDDGETWLVPSMRDAYGRLYAAGFAHSVEVWVDGRLAGGLYGVALGRMFFGESMFARVTDASKIALVHLAAQFERWGYPLIDCQLPTGHLVSMGAREMSRRTFVRAVDRLVRLDPVPAPWRLDADLLAARPAAPETG